MSEHSGWDADERVVDWDEMFGDLLPEHFAGRPDERRVAPHRENGSE